VEIFSNKIVVAVCTVTLTGGFSVLLIGHLIQFPCLLLGDFH